MTRSLFSAATISAIPDNAAVRDALARGDADAAMTNTFEAPRWAAGLERIERIGPLTHDVTALWISSERSDVAERLDAWLLEEEENGRLGALRTKWLGGGEPTATPVRALLAATAERLALMPFVTAAKKQMQRAVEDTAQEERVIASSLDAVARAARARHVAPPKESATRAFFTAQIEAAKEVQAKTSNAASDRASYDLENDLRPAIARISARMAFLLVRLPPATRAEVVLASARADLAEAGLADPTIARIAEAIAGAAPAER